MRAVVLPAADASALCGRIASALGYPLQCTDVRGEPLPGVVTLLYVEPLAHPTDASIAAVPVDEVIESLAEVAESVSGAVELGPEWDPPRRL